MVHQRDYSGGASLRVLLFDWATDGHHLEYAGHVARYLREAGDVVVFATWNEPSGRPVPGEEFDEVRYLASARSDARWQSVIARSVPKCLALAGRERVDVVHFLYLDRSEIALLASLAWRSRPYALLGTLFWPYFVRENGESVGIAKGLFHGTSSRALAQLLSASRMDGLFVHSERIKKLLLDRFGDRSLSDQIQVVPDPAKDPPKISTAEARAALGLPSQVPLILFFGDARADKGPDILLEALPNLKGSWVAVMAGSPGIVGEEQAGACRGRLADPERLITRFGYIPEEDVDRYFRAADVVVLPYRTSFKGTSGVLLRAAASGRPIIASDVGDVGPTVREARLGMVIPAESPEHLASALQIFFEHRDRVKQEVEPRALTYARANDWRVLGRAIRARYLAALESRAS
jgi:glycosyltransferase involved in cell wall biosynthesis